MTIINITLTYWNLINRRKKTKYLSGSLKSTKQDDECKNVKDLCGMSGTSITIYNHSNQKNIENCGIPNHPCIQSFHAILLKKKLRAKYFSDFHLYWPMILHSCNVNL